MRDPDDQPGCTAIIDSIERRWAKSDQEIFLAAIILNPFYQRQPFMAHELFNNAGIIALIGRVFKRVEKTDNIPTELYRQLQDYLTLDPNGRFQHLLVQLNIETNAAEEEVAIYYSCLPELLLTRRIVAETGAKSHRSH